MITSVHVTMRSGFCLAFRVCLCLFPISCSRFVFSCIFYNCNFGHHRWLMIRVCPNGTLPCLYHTWFSMGWPSFVSCWDYFPRIIVRYVPGLRPRAIIDRGGGEQMWESTVWCLLLVNAFLCRFTNAVMLLLLCACVCQLTMGCIWLAPNPNIFYLHIVHCMVFSGR